MLNRIIAAWHVLIDGNIQVLWGNGGLVIETDVLTAEVCEDCKPKKGKK